MREAFAQKDFAVDVETPHSAEELRERVRTAINAGCKTLIGMGGDGTMQALVREALGCPVSFGVIPLGGGNDFAAALGIGDWKEGVSAIVEGKVREVDVVRARFANGDQAAYLGGGGMGLDTEAMRYANGRFVRWPGRLRYLASAIAALRGYAGVKIKVDFPEGDTSQIEKHVLLAAVLNTPSYGSGVRLAPNASIDDGELELVTVEMLRPMEIVRAVVWLALKGELRTDHQERRRVKRVRLGASAGTLFQGDGEILGSAPVEIEVLPKAVKFFAP